MSQNAALEWRRALCAGILLGISGTLSALTPPTPEQIAQYKADGTWAARVAQANEDNQIDPYLAARAQYRLQLLADQAAGVPPEDIEYAPPPGRAGGMPSTGNVKVVVLLVDFDEYPHNAADTPTDVASKFFGDGVAGQYPYESLHNYYLRSSYGQLNISGNVLGWYRAAHNREYYLNDLFNNGEEELVEEVMDYFDAQGHDFSQYDANGDGNIDSLYIKWTGPDSGWSTFWWAKVKTRSSLHSLYRVDDKGYYKFCWSWINNVSYDGNTVYQPRVDIHETGHLLGLPDYYDTNDTQGPDGGVGGLDMMDANKGDHDGFSKFVLDWLTPRVVISGTKLLALNPLGTSPDCVIIMPGYTPGEIFDEYFLAEYRKNNTGNDVGYPTSGMCIWHLDATLTGSGSNRTFAYNNGTTAHKLIRRMEADGLEEIEANGSTDAGDFYKVGDTFSDTSMPNSRDYAGTATNVLINQFSTPGDTMSARFTIQSGLLVGDATWTLAGELCQPYNQVVDPGETVTLSIPLQNVGTSNVSNLVATLLPTGGVVGPSAPQTYGALVPLGPAVTKNFSFLASGVCGGTLTATLQLADGAVNLPDVVIEIPLGPSSGSCCVTPNGVGDFDGDGDVDQEDFGFFQACLTISNAAASAECQLGRLDLDLDVDQGDLAIFLRCHTQAGIAADPSCRNP